jgi:hypothetical protein
MAGRARTNAIIDKLHSLTRAYFEEEEGHFTPLDYIAARVEDCTPLITIANELSAELNDVVTPQRITAILIAGNGQDAVDARLAQARARASHVYAEESIAIVDAPADTTSEVSRAQSRARSRQWAASRWNRKDYGDDKGVSVNVTVGSLHLDALRAVPARATATIVSPATPQLPASTADAQVIDGE